MNTMVMTAGAPWSWSIRFPDAVNYWASISACEVRSQLRTNDNTESPLISNLHAFMTIAIDGNDIVVTWTMTGQDTRTLYAKQWGRDKSGYFTVMLSDVGVTDAQVLDTPTIKLLIRDTTTTAEG